MLPSNSCPVSREEGILLLMVWLSYGVEGTCLSSDVVRPIVEKAVSRRRMSSSRGRRRVWKDGHERLACRLHPASASAKARG